MSDNNIENKTLAEQMAALESSGETMVPIEDVRKLVESVKSLFDGDFKAPDLELYGEIGDLARFINDVRKDLGDFNPSQIADKEIPEASDQLDAIVKTTEQATGQIMDACDRLEESHSWLKDKLQNSNPPIPADTWMGVEDAINESKANITNIYEACNFQDLTGQRINKIVEALREVERHVLRMVMVFGLQHKNVDEEVRKEIEEEAQLLNGPALPGASALDQDDIDDILDALL